MAGLPFLTHRPAEATGLVSLAPALNGLLSLSLLTALPEGGVDPWVTRTAAALSDDQRRRNRLIFEGLGEALVPADSAAEFPQYLAALGAVAPAELRGRVLRGLSGTQVTEPDPEYLLASAPRFLQLAAQRYGSAAPSKDLLADVHALLRDPRAMHDLILGHLRQMWEAHLAVEWHRQAPILSSLAEWLQQRGLPRGTAADLIRSFIARDLPDAIAAQLDGVEHVVFVLSPHARLHAARFAAEATIWVFVLGRFQDLRTRRAPITRAELIGPLGTLADDSRLRILELLARYDDLSAQEIIAQVALSQPTVSRHLKQLCNTGFVAEQRGESGLKRYHLNARQVDGTFRSLKALLSPANAQDAEDDARAAQPPALSRFLDREGRVSTWPAKQQDQKAVLTYLGTKFESGRVYAEREINEILNQWHTYGDPATLRRELYNNRLIDRTADGARYWRGLA